MSARSIAKRLALVVTTVIATLLLVELALTVAGAWPPPPSPVVVEPGAQGRVRIVLRGDGRPDAESGERADAQVVLAPAEPPAGTRRAVVVGDSTIFGTHVRERSTIPQQLEVLLPPLAGGRWQALNLGREGIDARTVRLLAEAALAHLHPDLLVVYTGHNEFLPPKVEPYLAAHRAPLRAALARLLGSSRIGRALMPRRGGASKQEEAPARVRSAHARGIFESSELAPLRAPIRANFRQQLDELSRAAAERAVPVLFCGPTSNGREYGPIGSAFSQEVSPQQREELGALLRTAYDALHAGRLDECAAAVAAAGAIDPGVAEWMHVRAALSWARGEGETARVLDLQKWDLDESPRAASLEMLAIIEQVAGTAGAGDARVGYVEPGPALERGPGPDEPRIFLDNVHPGVYGQYLLTRELAVAATRLLDSASGDEADLRAQVPDYAQTCRALEIPPAYLRRSEDMTVMGDLNYASWAFDPRPYLERARAVLERMPEEDRSGGKFLIADLYLAILEQDAERAIARADEVVRSRGAKAAGLLRPILNMPRLSTAIEQAGLELTDADPPRLRRRPR